MFIIRDVTSGDVDDCVLVQSSSWPLLALARYYEYSRKGITRTGVTPLPGSCRTPAPQETRMMGDGAQERLIC
jgi:hypothetical protein